MSRRLMVLLMLCVFVTGCPGSGVGQSPLADEAAAAGGSSKALLRFSAIPDQNVTELSARFGPVAEYLAATLGVKVDYVPATDYQAAVEMFKNGDIQLAWFGGLTGVQARHAVAGARAIAQGEEDPEFYSYFIAHKETGLTRSGGFPKGIDKLRFTFGSESSTSGRLMPEFYIKQNTSKSPKEFFESTVGFSGSHDKTVLLVESGQFQVGVVNFKVYDRRVKEETTDPEMCRIIWKTPTYADYNFTAHPDLDTAFGAGFIDRLQKALLDMSDPKLLAAFPRKKLIAATNEDFATIHQVAVDLDMVR